MPNTFSKITTVTVGSGGATSIDFTSIPSSFTDLVLKLSCRTDSTGAPSVLMKLNGVTTNMTVKGLEGAGSGSVTSGSGTTPSVGVSTTGTHTASTFSNIEVYFPSYASSSYKTWSADSVSENNATTAYQDFTAGLWSSTSAINAISLYPSSNNWVQYSTATLYGLNKS
jgi:hypothetical protein